MPRTRFVVEYTAVHPMFVSAITTAWQVFDLDVVVDGKRLPICLCANGHAARNIADALNLGQD